MYVVFCFGGGEGGARDTVLDVCTCSQSDSGAFVCQLQRGTRLQSSGCGGSLRTTGPEFVTEMEPGSWDEFEMVVLEQATVTCEDVHAKMMIIDGLLCEAVPTTTTTTTKAYVPTNVSVICLTSVNSTHFIKYPFHLKNYMYIQY